jgi:hypothetical protein
VVNGDPLADVDLIADPQRSMVAIMKGRVIYENTTTTTT